ncbi:MAG TPA: hypothetical protein VMM14_06155 [Acidimicrobiia bacterium]|nr:hypothetical protein [Acidimicrobiia bacterium]
MDELWARVGLVVGALAVAGIAVVAQRARARRPVETITDTGFPRGVYLFSSSSCATCRQARDRLHAALGESGFVELSWEEHPEQFHEVSVEAVPAVLLVGEDGGGRLYHGQPERALRDLEERLDP